MTNRDHFIAALDADPSDQLTRAVFADWLEEHGDGGVDRRLAAGLRWMAANNKWPHKETMKFPIWNWHRNVARHDVHENSRIQMHLHVGRWWSENHESRHAAEVALAESLWEAGVTAPPIKMPDMTDRHEVY